MEQKKRRRRLCLAAKNVITKVGLDAPMLCKDNPVEGGAIFDKYRISMTDEWGLGVKRIKGIENIEC